MYIFQCADGVAYVEYPRWAKLCGIGMDGTENNFKVNFKEFKKNEPKFSATHATLWPNTEIARLRSFSKYDDVKTRDHMSFNTRSTGISIKYGFAILSTLLKRERHYIYNAPVVNLVRDFVRLATSIDFVIAFKPLFNRRTLCIGVDEQGNVANDSFWSPFDFHFRNIARTWESIKSDDPWNRLG
jgi:hypothetical protein